jgi:drug/metabolite transporter (DMT)-like permease
LSVAALGHGVPSAAAATAAALAGALCWTLASLLWRRLPTSLSAVRLNLLKNLLAFGLQLPLVALLPWQVPAPTLLLLALSGVLGIALGDAGIVLQQTALAGLPGGLAVALLSTAPLMALPLARLEGDDPGRVGVAAALAGLLGVSLVVGILPLPWG